MKNHHSKIQSYWKLKKHLDETNSVVQMKSTLNISREKHVIELCIPFVNKVHYSSMKWYSMNSEYEKRIHLSNMIEIIGKLNLWSFYFLEKFNFGRLGIFQQKVWHFEDPTDFWYILYAPMNLLDKAFFEYSYVYIFSNDFVCQKMGI